MEAIKEPLKRYNSLKALYNVLQSDKPMSIFSFILTYKQLRRNATREMIDAIPTLIDLACAMENRDFEKFLYEFRARITDHKWEYIPKEDDKTQELIDELKDTIECLEEDNCELMEDKDELWEKLNDSLATIESLNTQITEDSTLMEAQIESLHYQLDRSRDENAGLHKQISYLINENASISKALSDDSKSKIDKFICRDGPNVHYNKLCHCYINKQLEHTNPVPTGYKLL